MYKIITFQDIVRIPPSKFNKDLNEAAKEVLEELYEGQLLENVGLIISILDVKVSEIGRIVPGDGASYHKTVFNALVFSPTINEVVEGEIVTVEDFGLFIRLGPLEGLIHKSQIYDDKFQYDKSQGAMIGKETRYIVRRGDIVRARIVTVSSMAGTIRGFRIGLTMRQPFLGKIEWIKKELERIYKKSK